MLEPEAPRSVGKTEAGDATVSKFVMVATVENLIYGSSELKGGLGNSIPMLYETLPASFHP